MTSGGANRTVVSRVCFASTPASLSCVHNSIASVPAAARAPASSSSACDTWMAQWRTWRGGWTRVTRGHLEQSTATRLAHKSAIEQRRDLFLEDSAERLGALSEILVEEDAEGGDGDGTCERVAAEGRAVHAGGHRAHHL